MISIRTIAEDNIRMSARYLWYLLKMHDGNTTQGTAGVLPRAKGSIRANGLYDGHHPVRAKRAGTPEAIPLGVSRNGRRAPLGAAPNCNEVPHRLISDALELTVELKLFRNTTETDQCIKQKYSCVMV